VRCGNKPRPSCAWRASPARALPVGKESFSPPTATATARLWAILMISLPETKFILPRAVINA
jgi:hypothetical protein